MTVGAAILFAYLAERGLERCSNANVKAGYAQSDPNYAHQTLPSGRTKSIPFQSTYKELDCEKPQGEKEYELCQDWRSAETADQQACVARLQFWVGGFIGIIGLGGLIGIVAYTALAAKAASESADVAAKALVNLERAVIVLKEIYREGSLVKDPKTGDDTALLRVEIENSGTTRTRHMLTHVTFKEFTMAELVDWKLPADFAYPDVETGNDPASFVLGPKGTTKLGAFGIGVPALERMRRGETRGYLWGWVEYEDIFDGTPRRRTEWCMWIAKITPPLSAAAIEWTIYKEHNGMDEECPAERFRTAKGGGWIEPERPRISPS